MVRVICMRYKKEVWAHVNIPKEERVKRIRELYDVLKEYPDVKYEGLWVDDKGRGICIWEAPNAQIVREIVERIWKRPFSDLIIEVRRIQ